MRRWRILKGTALEVGRVLLAKLGHDPHGMLLRDRPWREILSATYHAHRGVEMRSRHKL